MQDAKLNSNPLIRSVIHTSFRTAVRDLGFPEIPKDSFQREISPYLRAPGSLFDDSPETLEKLWNAILRGEVVVTEMEGDTIVFYVRGSVGQRVLDVRLAWHGLQWHVTSVVSMYHRPLLRWNWFYRIAFAVSVVVAGIIGYAVHAPQSASKPATASTGQWDSVTTGVGQAKTTVNTTTNTTTSAVPQTGNDTSAASDNTTSNTTGNSTSGGTGHSTSSSASAYTFTLKPGMSIHDLSVFLHAHQLIHEPAVQFDMVLKNAGLDRTIRPGRYTFKPGMTKSQILHVIKSGPSK
ncbi:MULTISPECIES: hypothetical protein [Alicyclobacillus]|uniref:Endolytic transglycosylase MltG n=1 Tax=Alicyclobacillus acidoterrestris (strain ATCC 49025 / DSM 3922 / CIP 106132 / NCIMB 13137 / GD3B) TaxID=1356854 RepID=T0DUJ8_ALIAG|nr:MULTISPECIES: hypothetical protein [Alicyclobacillus]EPZ53156.1 hypothetical protein N007_18095 [Alicyclobacillus acidoterrestris ATCC 49025]UNO49171.1 endolytic transglycosylase MltG [Alicyclobacillus acidoterrestris]